MGLTNIFKNLQQRQLNKKCLETAYFGDFKNAVDLLDKGADINYIGRVSYVSETGSTLHDTMSLGHCAIANNNIKALSLFLEKGLDPNAVADGVPLIVAAIWEKQEDAALALLARGAKTDYVSNDLETPLSFAEQNGLTRVASEIRNAQPATPAVAAAGDIVAMKPLTLKRAP